VLHALDAGLFLNCRCYFGGGTAIVLRCGEYRESAGIDFLVSDIDGYRQLRQVATGKDGINALTQHPLTPLRDVRADQYGIRTLLDVDGEPIKIEIIHEGRINLDTPDRDDQVCGVATLTRLDLAASKLLANADRWADRAVFSRDLIDLAMMQPTASTLQNAISTASRAYDDSIITCLNAAIANLRENPRRLDECMTALGMHDTPKAVLWQRVKELSP
jgi:hypothetical protein